MPDRRTGAGGHHGRQGRGEDELRRVAPNRVDDRAVCGDIAAERAEPFGERAFNDIDAIHEAFAFGDAASARAIHANRMNLVDIGQRIVPLGELHDLPNRRDVAVHRIEAFEKDQLWPAGSRLDQQLLEVSDVIVPPDPLIAIRPPHALDHRIVVEGVGQDQAIRHQRRDCRNAREIRNPARGEDERGFLPVKVGKFLLEFDDAVMRSGNVARAARARAMPLRRGDRGVTHLRMASHAEIVVRTPDRDLALLLFPARPPERNREPFRVALEVDEDPIALLVLQAPYRIREVDAMVLIDRGHRYLRLHHLVQSRQASAAQPSNAACSRARSNPRPLAITKGLCSRRGANGAIEARPPLSSKQTQWAFVRTRPWMQSTSPKLPVAISSRRRSMLRASQIAGGSALQE